MSELVESDDVKDISREQGSWTVSETARTPLSDTRCDNESLNAESIVGQRPNHQGQCPADERGVTRKYSLSDVDGDVNVRKVISDIVGNLPRHPNDACEVARSPLSDVGCDVNSLNVGMTLMAVCQGIRMMHVKWHVLHWVVLTVMSTHRMSVKTWALV